MTLSINVDIGVKSSARTSTFQVSNKRVCKLLNNIWLYKIIIFTLNSPNSSWLRLGLRYCLPGHLTDYRIWYDPLNATMKITFLFILPF